MLNPFWTPDALPLWQQDHLAERQAIMLGAGLDPAAVEELALLDLIRVVGHLNPAEAAQLKTCSGVNPTRASSF